MKITKKIQQGNKETRKKRRKTGKLKVFVSLLVFIVLLLPLTVHGLGQGATENPAYVEEDAVQEAIEANLVTYSGALMAQARERELQYEWDYVLYHGLIDGTGIFDLSCEELESLVSEHRNKMIQLEYELAQAAKDAEAYAGEEEMASGEESIEYESEAYIEETEDNLGAVEFSSITPLSGVALVYTFGDFTQALATAEVNVISLQQDIVLTAGVTITRSVEIIGNGHMLSTANAQRITLGAAAANSQLRLEDIRLMRTPTATGESQNSLFVSATAASANWTFILGSDVRLGNGNTTVVTHTRGDTGYVHHRLNVNSTEANRSGLFEGPQATVRIEGGNNLLSMWPLSGTGGGTTPHMFQVRNFIMAPDAYLRIRAGNTSSAVIAMEGTNTLGQLILEANAELHIRNTGTRRSSDGTDQAQHSHGIYGMFAYARIENAILEVQSYMVGFRSRGNNTTTIRDGAVVTLYNYWHNSSGSPAMVFAQAYTDGADDNITANLTVDGAGSVLNLYSRTSNTAQHGGAIYFSGLNSSMNVTNGGQLNAFGFNASAMVFQGGGTSFNITGGGGIHAVSHGGGNWRAATVRFRRSGNMTFYMNNGIIYAEGEDRRGSNASEAFRMYGNGNGIFMNHNSQIQVINRGTGDAFGFDGGSTGFANGTHFSLETGSRLHAEALSGRALLHDDNNRYILITAGIDTVFVAHGFTTGTAAGVIGGTNTGNSGSNPHIRFNIYRPLYFDIRNNSGAQALRVGSSSIWNGTDTDLAVWHTGAGGAALDRNPDNLWSRINFGFTGTNLNQAPTSNLPAAQDWLRAPTGGASRFARISANNARPIVDELRIPTDADRRIFGHISVPEGGWAAGYTRSAWENEVVVEVVVRNPANQVVLTQRVPTGRRYVFGTYRDGMFEVVLDYFIPENYTVEVTAAWRVSGNLEAPGQTPPRYHQARAEEILVDIVRSRDVTPPTPITLDVQDINTFMTAVQGSGAPGSTIRVTLNGDWITDDAVIRTVIVDSEGDFTFSLAGLNLVEGDVIAIYASDNKGLADLEDVPWRPATSHALGNINPASRTYYHDAVFYPRPQWTVIFTGALSLESFPTLINFGNVPISSGPISRLWQQYEGSSLIISDTRLTGNRSNWVLRARVYEELENEEGHVLTDALRYRLPSGTVISLGDDLANIYRRNDFWATPTGIEERTNISDLSWRNQVIDPANLLPVNGLFVDTHGGNVFVTSPYSGVIEWNLMEDLPD